MSVLRDAFRIFDNEGKGNIQLEMVKEILTLLGHEVNDDELDEVMEQFDEDENGTIEFAEFIKLAGDFFKDLSEVKNVWQFITSSEEFVEPEQEYNEAKNDLRELFVLYDKEQKGFIPVADFKLILKEIDSDLPDTEAEAIVKELDTDFSGTIEFDGKFLTKN